MTREERAAVALRLRAQGLTAAQIAARMGVSRSYAASLYRDPDGRQEKSRKDAYRGTCESCGARTHGSNGRSRAPRFCATCHGPSTRIWTREAVIEAIQRWNREHGSPPYSDDWDRSANGYPHRSSCYGPGAPFKKWADAIEAAGFPRPYSGTRRPKAAA